MLDKGSCKLNIVCDLERGVLPCLGRGGGGGGGGGEEEVVMHKQ